MTDYAAIDALAGKQLGVVTRAQLRELGLGDDAIDSWLRAKRLHRLHRGVFRVGPITAPRARELAAVLACGPRACLSHRSAGWLWQLLPDPGDQLPVDISITTGHRRQRRNVRVRRVQLDKKDRTMLCGISITSLPRTLLDLASILDRSAFERVLAQADRLHQFDRKALLTVVKSNSGRAGVPVLRTWLHDETGPALTRSEAEARFLALIRKAHLPVPETNVRVGTYEIDFLWRQERLVVEVDGRAYHSSPSSFESDRRRDATLTASGFTVLRITWRQLTREPEATLALLAQTLARAGMQPVHQSKTKRGAPLRIDRRA